MTDAGRSQAFAELCGRRGMRPVKDTRTAFSPAGPGVDALRAALANAFASADFSPFLPPALPLNEQAIVAAP